MLMAALFGVLAAASNARRAAPILARRVDTAIKGKGLPLTPLPLGSNIYGETPLSEEKRKRDKRQPVWANLIREVEKRSGRKRSRNIERKGGKRKTDKGRYKAEHRWRVKEKTAEGGKRKTAVGKYKEVNRWGR